MTWRRLTYKGSSCKHVVEKSFLYPYPLYIACDDCYYPGSLKPNSKPVINWMKLQIPLSMRD